MLFGLLFGCGAGIGLAVGLAIGGLLVGMGFKKAIGEVAKEQREDWAKQREIMLETQDVFVRIAQAVEALEGK